jgi:alpha-tubulin suppressor-like RCC1 family protein
VSGDLRFATLTAGGGYQVCGLTVAGAAYCWGYNSKGRLGDGSQRTSTLPVPVSGGIAFAQLVAGGYGDFGHTCGLTSNGAAYCWGDNGVGAVGDGSSDDRLTPTAVAGGLNFVSIDAGFRHSCARANAGTVLLGLWQHGPAGQTPPARVLCR